MIISKRLKAISDFIPPLTHVIDVGADHALLDIYLEKEKSCVCLATDISKKCISKAEENIKKYKANVKTQVADGLNGLDTKDKYIVISGMGTDNILKIVPDKLDNVIVSSHTKLSHLRREMFKKGYYIHRERAIFDKKYYVIIHFKKGRKKTNIYVSPHLKNNKDYMKYLKNKYEFIYRHNKKIFTKIKVYFILKKFKQIL